MASPVSLKNLKQSGKFCIDTYPNLHVYTYFLWTEGGRVHSAAVLSHKY